MSKKILIMAGGTGGHIFPALSIAKELSKRGAIVEWLGGRDSMESNLVPNHEIKFGASFTNHFFFPGETSLSINETQPNASENFSLDTTINFSDNIKANEVFFYAEDNLNITPVSYTHLTLPTKA